MTTASGSWFNRRPTTRLGRWAVGLMVLFLVLFFINSAIFMPLFGYRTETTWWQQNLMLFCGVFMMLCGLASGVVGLVAVIKDHERSWMVWVTVLPLAFVLFFLLGEFLVPH